MSKYAYIVAADYKYTPELCACLNSLDAVGNKQDVHVVGINLPETFIEQFDKLDYTVFYHRISEGEIKESRGISEVTCRKRYWYAAAYGRDYDAVCILDADLIFARNPIQFFDIAAKTGFILGPTKEQNKVYDDDHHLTNGKWEWNVPRGFWNDKDMCNCPVFIDAEKWDKALRLEWEVFASQGFKAPDMDAMNLAFLQFGAYDQIVRLPGLQWLGTNEQMLKPYIRVVDRHGKLFNECGTEIFCYHGHYYHQKWRNCQLDNRHRCAEGYLGCSEKTDDMARGSLELLYQNFLKMLDWKIRVDKISYRE